MSELWKKIRASKVMRFVKIVSESASLALFLSIIFFAYEMVENMQESKEMTDNLIKIQNSLSTRYLGKFPDFLPDINNLYEQANSEDSIIILEDVLFYGITSAPKDFYEANSKLLALAKQGSPVMISYYKPRGLAYNLTIQEWLLSPKNYKHYQDTMRLFKERNGLYRKHKRILKDSCEWQKMPKEETDKLLIGLLDRYFADIIGHETLVKQAKYMRREIQNLDSLNTNEICSAPIDDNEQVSSLLLERYFARTRAADKKAFKSMVNKYRKPTIDWVNTKSDTTQDIALQMCQEMDSVRLKYLGKENAPVDKITYADFMNMFQEMTEVMQRIYANSSITLVPIDDFLSVRSWLVCGKGKDNQAIMAFPSRYSSSEIGFYTTDESTKDYIKTMHWGILTNYVKESKDLK